MSTQCILDLDIGNTFVKWRFDGALGRLPTNRFTTTDLLSACGTNPRRIRLSSVANHNQVARFVEDIRLHCGVVVEVARTSAYAAGVTNSYENPEQMGVDRWLGMVAAYNEFARACCVVSCGTAITIDYVDQQGVHLGGYILPGAKLLRNGLLKNTERIGASEFSSEQGWHHLGPGDNTESAVTQGMNLILHSVANEVHSGLTDKLGQQAVLVICGGDAEHFHQLVGQGQVRSTLVLDGLNYLLP